ncbi:hydrogenase iron-sulfur subunit [Desulfopila inferna]|uniref:hydrogenase iron-sulfur subunit n=1 Tax=Desulfopila inferna TaxID=468528 RepID=UPI001966806D|nr:hydrogenase iron-sulfur subunit [Desulfopila inferna]MBM9603431.1 hydrogenase iron-sulfur subunit [Desulfopila inferna]
MNQEPKIIAFCCNWCSYAAADLAGSSRLKYPHNIRIIRVMCSGMVHPELVLEALSKGAGGVVILGCHLGECHYIDGNYKALARSDMIADLLEDFGFEQERFSISWISSAEPEKFVEVVTEMTERVKQLDSAGVQETD